MTSPDTAVVTAPKTASGIAARTPGQLAWGRFRNDRKTVASAIIVLITLILAILAPIFVAAKIIDPFSINQNLINANALPIGDWGGISWAHPLGVEPGIGRDSMSRIWFGLSYSLMISAGAALLSVSIGTVMGIIAGMSRGAADTIIGRTIDLILSFPQTLMLLALSSTIITFMVTRFGVPEGNTVQALYVVLVLSAFGWPPVARIIRGQVLSLREREFIDAARLFGASKARLWFREVLPNLWAPILVQFTLILPAYISAETALAYLGVSVLPPTPTIGNILADSIQYASADFLYFFLPGFLLVTIVVSFNLLGDGVRDALDPKAGRR
ncbi:MAG TPA: ABC transporter permease [Microbacteriaceae bacterium]|nr:ABC transporter permease [Microbacteriaceae bacterium]